MFGIIICILIFFYFFLNQLLKIIFYLIWIIQIRIFARITLIWTTPIASKTILTTIRTFSRSIKESTWAWRNTLNKNFGILKNHI
jgi:hypothetical protein